MSEYDMICHKLERLEQAVEKIAETVSQLKDYNIQNREKRRECEDHFDQRYALSREMKSLVKEEIEKCNKTSMSKAKDIIWIVNVAVILAHLIFQIF